MRHLTEKQIAHLKSKYGESAVEIYQEIAAFVESGALAEATAATDEEINDIAAHM